MPDPTVPSPHDPPRPEPAYLTARMSGLGSAHVTADRWPGGDVGVRISAPHCAVSLDGRPDHVRQVLTDALAQLDAIKAAGR